ncbi:MAG: glycosyl transferase GT4 family protein, partial [Elusimicrobia bacterium]
MNILLVQETDWLKRNPHQQHHLADNLSLRGHRVRVIDYEHLWPGEKKKKRFSRRQIFSGISNPSR